MVKHFQAGLGGGLRCARSLSAVMALSVVLTASPGGAGTVTVPNYSFESPVVPPVSPYAGPDVDYWEKSPQPSWYDPAQNSNTPWDYLMGEFFNVQFPGQYIDNCDGSQAAFLFAVPEVALFQDYGSIYGTNTTPSHAFNAKFNVGSSYDLRVGVIGGGGGMQAGVTLALELYYRDASNNIVVVASTSITNTTTAFPTNTHFVDFAAHAAKVNASDPWAGQNIGIQLLSTVSAGLAGGYWDLDNVRLTETVSPGFSLVSAGVINGQFTLAVTSDPGVRFEILASTNLTAAPAGWTSLGTFTNTTGVAAFTDTSGKLGWRYYRARQL